MKNNLQLAKNAQYQWRPELKTGIVRTDIKLAIAELKDIEDQHGEITPALLVESSRKKKSVFHKYFEWDNEIAADSWRFMQARYMLGAIQVNVISEGKPRQMQAYQITKKATAKTGNTTYTKFSALTQENKAFILQQCVTDLVRVKNKLQANDFDELLPNVDKAIKALQKESEVIHITSS